MPSNKRSDMQVQQDRIKIMRLLGRGWSKLEIAQALGVHASQITYDLKIVMNQIVAERNEINQEMLALERLKLRTLEQETWEAFERSCKPPAKKVLFDGFSAKRKIKPTAKETEEEEKARRLPGNPQFIKILVDIHKQRCELEGLYPSKEISIKGQVNTVSVNWDLLAQGIPENGEIPDLVEAEIQKLIANHEAEKNGNGQIIETNGKIVSHGYEPGPKPPKEPYKDDPGVEGTALPPGIETYEEEENLDDFTDDQR